jgi:predicted dehydrogenase
MDRRVFLRQSATAAGAAALATAAGPRSARAGQASPNETVRVGLIGIGGMGSGHLNKLIAMNKKGEPVKVVAVCDVWQKRLDAAAQTAGGEAAGVKKFTDYRKLLEDKDIDAVLIATPHHWHAPITIAAAEAGKDIYCEKPMTWHGDLTAPIRVAEAVAKNKRVMQVGTNGLSDSIYPQAREYLATGKLGQLIHAQASDMRNGYIDVYDPKRSDADLKPGQNLDWEMWLGPAPKREFDSGRYLSFRVFWDYAEGVGMDFFPHMLTPLVYVMKLGFPKRVTASGGLYDHKDGRETPDIFTTLIEYPDGPSILLLGGVSNDSNLPMVIRGTDATLTFDTGPGAVIEPQGSRLKDRKREEIAREQEDSLDAHWMDFIRCIKSREKPRSNEVIGSQVTMALAMGVHAYREGRAYEFDEATKTAKPV